jgi:hypothetical protein
MTPQQRKRLRQKLEDFFAAHYSAFDQEERLLRLGHRESQWLRYLGCFAEDKRKRLEATRQLCPQKVFLADLHSHSGYSDGSALSIEEISRWAEAFGLDLQAVTDHNTIEQKKETDKFPNLGCGMEIRAGRHHLLLLDINEAIEPAEKDETLSDRMAAIRSSGKFPIIAHPCGWRTTTYLPPRVALIHHLEGPFGIEIGNAAANLFDYYDHTDAAAVRLWDQLLRSGKRVIGLGNTDAHNIFAMGLIWNGLLGRRPKKGKMDRRISKGRHFVSDAPFIFIKVNGAQMGQEIEAGSGKVEIEVEAHDSLGLSKLRLIKNGRSFRTKNSATASRSLRIKLKDKIDAGRAYFRAEVYAKDFRKGYTNPIWVRR